ncbi:hypothetical protein SAMN05421579_1862 [Xenorhabdus japonica]|uniref:Uncharacterized protein n=1 Tax=Xenorhabdus japonica TaxID=53341 RepID=A0A1I5EM18_9GAMM|nr:hypothetical protein SAMN05421579_1862 [Xenorhabdus japonica]
MPGDTYLLPEHCRTNHSNAWLLGTPWMLKTILDVTRISHRR